ncbi:oligosaccharide flippase family protein [Acinetobacter indicus]|uniref:oligosaccharide flippase family protein n=1 Tax=Acinetobacter indicus TaxID=756892 RepID=UPI000CEBA7B7|nr:oligosaccharide flippase family protein [Acinetobacter indicus]
MKEILSLLQKAKWLVGGNFIFAFSQWFILIMLARMTTKENLGQYALALAIVSPVFAVTNLQLRPLYILDENSKRDFTYANFYYLRLISSVFALAICLFFGFFSNVYIGVLLLVASIKFFESFSDIIYAYYNAKDKTQLISKSLLIKGFSSVFAVFLGLYFFNFYIALILFLSVYFLLWLFLDNLYIIKTSEVKEKTINLNIMKTAIPMGVSLGIVTLQGNVPRLFLERYLSVEAVGVFTVLTYFIIVGSIFINSICQYLSPRLTKAWYNDKKHFKKLLLSALSIAFILGCGAIIFIHFFGEIVLKLIYGNDFLEYKSELSLVMIAGLFLYLATVIGYSLTSIGFIKKQIYLFSIVLATTLIASYVLIPHYGIVGGIISLMLSYSVQFLAGLIVVFFGLRKE